MITVKELIERLQTFDQNLRVVTPGFDESEFEDISRIELVKVIFHDNEEIGHCGRHKEIWDKDSEEFKNSEYKTALKINW